MASNLLPYGDMENANVQVAAMLPTDLFGVWFDTIADIKIAMRKHGLVVVGFDAWAYVGGWIAYTDDLATGVRQIAVFHDHGDQYTLDLRVFDTVDQATDYLQVYK